jgi:Protein of unknown function (DUF2568)
MTPAQAGTLMLRVTMETGVIAALAYWGAHTGTSTAASVFLAIGAPAIGFGIWGTLDFRFAGRAAEPLRLLEELTICGLAAAALYIADQPALAIALATLSAGYHGLVYATGERLLKRSEQAPTQLESATAETRGPADAMRRRP